MKSGRGECCRLTREQAISKLGEDATNIEWYCWEKKCATGVGEFYFGKCHDRPLAVYGGIGAGVLVLVIIGIIILMKKNKTVVENV